MHLIPQLSGDAGVYQTVSLMRWKVNAAIAHPLVRRFAFLSSEQCPRMPSGHACIAFSILGHVKQYMRYVRDPLGVELLHDPVMIARAIHEKRQPYGDCDDFSMYTAALLKSIGLPAEFVVIGRGTVLHHVFVSSGPYALDGTRENGSYMAQPPGRVERFPI